MDYSEGANGGNDLCSWKTGVVSIISGMDTAALILQSQSGACRPMVYGPSRCTVIHVGLRFISRRPSSLFRGYSKKHDGKPCCIAKLCAFY